MKSIITEKFQTTIPKKVRENLKLSVNDTLSWEIEGEKAVIKPMKTPFLKYRNAVKVGKGDISKDIAIARDQIGGKFTGSPREISTEY